jgi:23S rRNA (adenine2503-C2)-methyltransferase
VKKSIEMLIDKNGIGIPRRKITLSTSGVVPILERISEELKVEIAISLHATTNELRNQLVPINKTFPIEDLLETCK